MSDETRMQRLKEYYQTNDPEAIRQEGANLLASKAQREADWMQELATKRQALAGQQTKPT